MRTMFAIAILLGVGSPRPALAAVTAAQRCAAAKLKAAGVRLAVEIECARKAVLKGGTPDAECLAKGGAKLAAAFAKAERHGACALSADAAAANDQLGTCVGSLAGSPSASTTSTTTVVTCTSSTTTTLPSDPAQTCVDLVNGYRASVGLPPYARWTQEESCAGTQAQMDAIANMAHSSFGSCNEFAQSDCVGWPGPPPSMVAPCLAQMWDEGPGDFQSHGEYLNMRNASYTQLACGFVVLDDGLVWAVLDYR